MNKILLASLSLAFLSSAASAPCGWDFARASEEGLPPTYCFARQIRGNETFNGQLNLACSGSECPASNSVLNIL